MNLKTDNVGFVCADLLDQFLSPIVHIKHLKIQVDEC